MSPKTARSKSSKSNSSSAIIIIGGGVVLLVLLGVYFWGSSGPGLTPKDFRKMSTEEVGELTRVGSKQEKQLANDELVRRTRFVKPDNRQPPPYRKPNPPKNPTKKTFSKPKSNPVLAIKEMRRNLRDESLEPKERENMAHQLAKAYDWDSIEVLIEALENDPSPKVQLEASKSLATLMGGFGKWFDPDKPEQHAAAVKFYKMQWNRIKGTATERRIRERHKKMLARRKLKKPSKQLKPKQKPPEEPST